MRTITTMACAFGLCWVAACGGDDAARTCPPDYPVERDGFCYRPDGGAMPVDGGGTDSGADGGDSGGEGEGEDGGGEGEGEDSGMPPADGGPVICSPSHPIVMGMRRYCNPGDCFCATPDACFSEDTAEACCEVPVVCGSTDADAGPGVICSGTHPIVGGGMRTCDPGNCFCADPDACFPTDTAEACCPGAVVCY